MAKKLMALLAAVALAGAAQAAAVAWSVSITPTQTPTGGWCAAGSLVYMFDGSQYSCDTVLGALSAGDMTILANSLATSATTDGNGSISLSGDAINPIETDMLLGSTYDAIFVYLDSDSLSSATKYLTAESGIKQVRVASFNALTRVNNWTSIAAPEPTSGLLLLVGGALLALRRRRA